MYATGVTIWQTLGNGFVTNVDVVDTNDELHDVWSGTDPSLPGTPIDFEAHWPETEYLVKGVKITVDTDHNLDTWEEIDAVQLHGSLFPNATAVEGILTESHHWPLTTDAADLAGSTDASLMGGARIDGGSLVLDGLQAYLDLGDNFVPTTTDGFSFTARVRLDEQKNGIILWLGDSQNGDAFVLETDSISFETIIE